MSKKPRAGGVPPSEEPDSVPEEEHQPLTVPLDDLRSPILEDVIRSMKIELDETVRRLDQLYRYTVGDRTGWRYPAPSFAIPHSRDADFPAPNYEADGGPRKPQRPRRAGRSPLRPVSDRAATRSSAQPQCPPPSCLAPPPSFAARLPGASG